MSWKQEDIARMLRELESEISRLETENEELRAKIDEQDSSSYPIIEEGAV